MSKKTVVVLALASTAFLTGTAVAAVTTFKVNNADGSTVTVNCNNLPTAIKTTTTGRCNWTGKPAPKTTTMPTTTTVPTTGVTTTTVPPVAGGYPNASNTGVPSGTALQVISGNYTASAGEVIEGKTITGGLTITGNGVVIRNSEIYGTVSNGSGHYSFTITDSTVGNPSGYCDGNVAIQFDKYVATRVKVRNFGDAFRGSSNSGVSDILIQDSFAYLCSNAGDHSDGYQGYLAGSNVRLIHNTLDQRNAPDATAPLFNADASKAVYAENNLLAGGSYTIRVYDDTNQHSTIKNNKVVTNGLNPGTTAWHYGPVNSSCNTFVVNGEPTWTGNRLVTIDADYNVTDAGNLDCA